MTRALLVIKLTADESINFDLTNLAPDGLLFFYKKNDMIKLMKYRNWVILALVLSGLLLSVLFIFTSPREVGLIGILTVIIAIYTLFNSCIYLIMVAFSRKMESVNNRKRFLVSSALAFIPVFLIIFNSLNTLNIIGLILIFLFEAVIIFLIVNRT